MFNEQNNIENKVVIRHIEPHMVSNGQEQVKYGIGFNIYFANCSSQMINIIFDPVKTKIIANGTIRPETKYPEKLLLPYEYGIPNAVRTSYLEYEKVNSNEEGNVTIHIDIAFKYAINNSTTNKYEALYTYKAECIISKTNEGEPCIITTSFNLQNSLL